MTLSSPDKNIRFELAIQKGQPVYAVSYTVVKEQGLEGTTYSINRGEALALVAPYAAPVTYFHLNYITLLK